MERSRPERILGVDFGTSTCSAGIHDSAGPKLVLDRADAAIPSTMFFPMRGDPVLGLDALRMLAVQPTNTVRSIKRILGRSFDDRHVKGQARTLYYPLRQGPEGTIILGLTSGDVTCEQVVAAIFATLASLAERRFACRVRQIVATVPADASPRYEAAIRRAASLAHLEVLETLPEPVAGALPMRLHLQETDRRVMICDFGGGTFDVTLIEAGYRKLDVVASHGDDYLGGDDFDDKLMEAVASVVFSRSSFDMLRDAALRHRLQLRCEEAKRSLSVRPEVRLRLHDAYRHEGRQCDIDAIIERSWIEPRWEPLVERALLVVDQLLGGVSMTTSDVDQVALIGGSSLIPLFRRRLEERFANGVVLDSVGARTAVVEGAILRCAAYESQAHSSAPPFVAAQG